MNEVLIMVKIIRKPGKIFAYKTRTTIANSQAEIRRILQKYDCRFIGLLNNPENIQQKMLIFQIPTRQSGFRDRN